jgi:hypothetical protein
MLLENVRILSDSYSLLLLIVLMYNDYRLHVGFVVACFLRELLYCGLLAFSTSLLITDCMLDLLWLVFFENCCIVGCSFSLRVVCCGSGGWLLRMVVRVAWELLCELTIAALPDSNLLM